MKDVVILGGGISGLSLAWYLKKQHGPKINITLLEKEEHMGGWFATLEKDGFVFDVGPHYLFTMESKDVFNLIEELSLDDQVILSNLKSNVSRLYKQGEIYKIPKTFKEMLFSPLTNGLIAGLVHEWFAPKGDNHDESIYDFIRRRFSLTLADGFGEAYIAGIVSGDIKKLSMKAYLPRILLLEKEYGSVVKGLLNKKVPPSIEKNPKLEEIQKHAAINFKKGLAVLTDAMADALKDQIIHKKVTKLRLSDKQNISIELEDGTKIEPEHVFSTIPSFALAEILPNEYSSLKEELRSFYYKSMAVVSVGFKSNVLYQDGYGYVIPFSEHKPVIGVLWDSSVFPDMNQHPQETRFTVMIGDDHLPKSFDEMTEEEFKAIALNEIKKTLAIKEDPDFIHVTLIKKGIPRFLVGHQEKVSSIVDQLKELAPKMTLIGSGFYGAAISKCLINAKKAALDFVVD
jgi:oxygen-dependent protoporphyrinogen oxidase